MNCPIRFPVPDWEQRPYQIAIREDLRKTLQTHRCVLVVAPPNAGKTVIFEEEIREALQDGKRVCVVVPSVALMEQTLARLLHLKPGIIWGDKTNGADRQLQVASVQSLATRLSKYEFDLVVVDEAHHCPAASWMKVLDRYKTSKVIGFTATPKRLDGKGLGLCGFTAIVRGPWVDALTPEYMAPYVYFAPSVPSLLGQPEGGDYTEKYLAAAGIEMGVLIGDAVKHYSENTPGKAGLVFCMSINDSKKTVDKFRAAGFSARHLDGDTSESERSAILMQYATGRINLICCCEVISEGFDVPNVDVVIQLRPTRSFALWMQQIGRGLRRDPSNPGKQLHIIDCAGNWYRFWAPCVDRRYGLDGKDSICELEEKIATKLCRCATCGFVGNSADGKCGQCGIESIYASAVRHGFMRRGLRWRDGDLVQVGGGVRTFASRRGESWRFQIAVDGNRWIKHGHKGASIDEICALLDRVNNHFCGYAPDSIDDWARAIEIQQRVNKTTYKKTKKEGVFILEHKGKTWRRRVNLNTPAAKVDSVLTKVNAYYEKTMPASKTEWKRVIKSILICERGY